MSNAAPRTTFVLLHFLGGSAREWHAVREHWGGQADALALDLPGFGEAAGVGGYSVDEMADHVARAVAEVAPARWILVGHSMGAKVACALARRIADGATDLPGLAGLALVAGSPPAPEPMAEERRERMLGWFRDDPTTSRAQAEEFVDANVVRLPAADRALAVEDVLRLDPRAWCAWLESGSREDWRGRIGRLAVPALVVAGAEDGDLGPDAQERLTLPHFARARLVALGGARHLLPMERPAELARLLLDFARETADAGSAVVDPAYLDLIRSDRVSPKLRDILLKRAEPDDPTYVPRSMTAGQLVLLRALLARLIPQDGPATIDLAARLDAMMAEARGNGWRFESLPTDPDAYRHALDTLAEARGPGGRRFLHEDAAGQDAIVTAMAAGDLHVPAGPLDAAALGRWFEEVLSDAVRLHVAHPATMARIGYSGIANGGPGGAAFAGFRHVGIGEREPFEPRPSSSTPTGAAS